MIERDGILVGWTEWTDLEAARWIIAFWVSWETGFGLVPNEGTLTLTGIDSIKRIMNGDGFDVELGALDGFRFGANEAQESGLGIVGIQ